MSIHGVWLNHSSLAIPGYVGYHYLFIQRDLKSRTKCNGWLLVAWQVHATKQPHWSRPRWPQPSAPWHRRASARSSAKEEVNARASSSTRLARCATSTTSPVALKWFSPAPSLDPKAAATTRLWVSNFVFSKIVCLKTNTTASNWSRFYEQTAWTSHSCSFQG